MSEAKGWTPTLPLGEAPGLDAGLTARREWTQKKQDWRACRNYDVMRVFCYWCLSNDDQLFMDKGARGGTYKYCSEKCRDTAALPLMYGRT